MTVDCQHTLPCIIAVLLLGAVYVKAKLPLLGGITGFCFLFLTGIENKRVIPPSYMFSYSVTVAHGLITRIQKNIKV